LKTVLVHGCFDILHYGHLKHFEEAKKYGNRLVVSLTSDRFINKGPGRPYFCYEKRAAMVKAIACVDEVFISDEPTAIGAIRKFQPDFYVKGPDYKDFANDVTGEILNEKAAVEKHGGKLVFTDEETFSSSTIINKFFQPWSDEQRAQIDKINSLGGMGAIERAIEEIFKLKVAVVGESIIDTYRFVNPEGISSKSPSLSARFLREEQYHGGSTAIWAHLRNFTDFKGPLLTQYDRIEKIRYISGNQRIFEVTHIEDDGWKKHSPKNFLRQLRDESKWADVVILADFGHGLFEGEVLGALGDISTFIGLNVQTNSSNFGFNVINKHQRFDYLCIDKREARLAEHDRYSDPMEIAGRIKEKISPRAMAITLGPDGSTLMSSGTHHAPAFSDVVIDATGAGDAYFAITTCLLKTGCDEALIPFIGNVFAGLKTKIIGNKNSVSKASLLKACSGILK
jgi:rfaE bifunctional protein nucleotidyltransferase chain/domain